MSAPLSEPIVLLQSRLYYLRIGNYSAPRRSSSSTLASMTIWTPRAAELPGPLYRRVAKALEEDIAAGRISAGTRLPTHRELARALDTTVVTASRAYREAAQMGLIQGEVGRGTFVLASDSAGAAGAAHAA